MLMAFFWFCFVIILTDELGPVPFVMDTVKFLMNIIPHTQFGSHKIRKSVLLEVTLLILKVRTFIKVKLTRKEK